jgi:steroid delta-isomerase-like uncharacterized protein
MEDAMKKKTEDLITAWNTHDEGALLSLFTEDCVYVDIATGVISRGQDELKAFIRETFAWSPDIKFELKSFFTAGDWAASEWIMSGTHSGDAPGMPATGKAFSVPGAWITEMHDGKIKRNSDYWNLAAFMQQVGMLHASPK